MYKVQKLNTLKLSDKKVLVWRSDSKKWVIEKVSSFYHWIGNSELAYTYWTDLPRDMTTDE